MNIYGTVEIDARHLGRASHVPAGARARVNLSYLRDVPLDDLRQIATLTYGAAEVEVVGRSAAGIAQAVRYLRERAADWQRVA